MDLTAETSRRVRTANIILSMVAFTLLLTLALGPIYQAHRGVLNATVIQNVLFPPPVH